MQTISNVVTGAPRTWLRLEGLVAMLLTLFLYVRGGHSSLLLAVLFLLPDLSFAGYLRRPRVGSWCYNVVHSSWGRSCSAPDCSPQACRRHMR